MSRPLSTAGWLIARRGAAALLLGLITTTSGCSTFGEEPPASSCAFYLQATGSTASLRGLCVVDPQIAWASGTGGTCLRTTDGGDTWESLTIPNSSDLDFRDVHAIDGSTSWLMSAGSGEASQIFKTVDGGASWERQFVNEHPDGFYDGIAFWDELRGIAYGDPIAGSFAILLTDDGGNTWRPLDPADIPPALPGEAGFAASGTGLIALGDGYAWFCTGGGAAVRVFRSTDFGETWSVSETPVQALIPSAGGFSLDFLDPDHGVLVGGDYRQPEQSRDNAAITADGGVTWTRAESLPSGHRACVAYAKDAGRATLLTVGRAGADASNDGGRTWFPVPCEGFYCVGFSGSESGLAAGSDGRIARFDLER